MIQDFLGLLVTILCVSSLMLLYALVTSLTFLYAVWLVVNKLLFPAKIVAGWTSVLVAVLFLGGVQLISIGVLGSYLGRVFYETKNRPLYFVAEKHGFADDDANSFIGSGKETS